MILVYNVSLYLNKKVEEAKRQNHCQENGSCETDRNDGTKNAAERPQKIRQRHGYHIIDRADVFGEAVHNPP